MEATHIMYEQMWLSGLKYGLFTTQKWFELGLGLHPLHHEVLATRSLGPHFFLRRSYEGLNSLFKKWAGLNFSTQVFFRKCLFVDIMCSCRSFCLFIIIIILCVPFFLPLILCVCVWMFFLSGIVLSWIIENFGFNCLKDLFYLYLFLSEMGGKNKLVWVSNGFHSDSTIARRIKEVNST